MPRTPGKGHEALRRGRWSNAGSEYFLTLCIQKQQAGLTAATLLPVILGQLNKLEAEQIWHVRTATVMPDHIHLLVVLGDATDLSSSIRLFKGKLSPSLRAAGLKWESGYYDHRIRTDEDHLPIFLYIFLNPYQKKLLAAAQTWPGYTCSKEDLTWFGELTSSDCPYPEWLA